MIAVLVDVELCQSPGTSTAKLSAIFLTRIGSYLSLVSLGKVTRTVDTWARPVIGTFFFLSFRTQPGRKVELQELPSRVELLRTKHGI